MSQTSPPPVPGLGRRMAGGVFWSLAGLLISRGLTLAAFAVAARILGKAGYGELGVLQSTAGVFEVFAGLGTGLTAARYVAEFRDRDPARAGRIIALSELLAVGGGAMVTVVVLLAAPWLAAVLLNAPQLEPQLRIVALLPLFGALNGAQVGGLTALEAFRPLARANLLAGLLGLPVLVAGVVFGGLSGAAAGLVAGAALNCLVNRYTLNRRAQTAGIPLDYRGAGREWRILWAFNLPAVLSSLLVGPTQWLCAVLLVNQPNGYTEMGVYTAARQWAFLIALPATRISAVALPMLANLHGNRQSGATRRLLGYNLLLTAGVSSVLAAGMALAAPLILWSYGPAFAAGAPVLATLAGAAVLMAVLDVLGQTLAVAGRMWLGFGLNLAWATVLLAGTRAFCPQGAQGLANAMVLAYTFHAVVVGLFAIGFVRDRGQSATGSQSGKELPAMAWLTDQLEAVPCDLCGAREAQPVRTRPDGMRVVQCAGCGLCYLNPRPRAEHVYRLYDGAYFRKASAPAGVGYAGNGYEEEQGLVRAEAQRRLAVVEREVGVVGKTLLEVGCATGEFCALAATAGAAVVGIDLSTDAIEVARRRYPGLDLRAGTVTEAPAGPYDLVCAFEVIEHVLSPREFFAVAARLLKPGGLLVLSTPNLASGRAAGYDRWLGFETSFEHLYFFGRDTLAAYAAEHGLTLRHCFTGGGDGVVAHRRGLARVARNVLEATGLLGPLRKLLRKPGRPASWDYQEGESHHNLLVVCQRL
jgi:O-antigen/teichoic acid export membrane protein/SAM-dependent methyltransferase